MWIKPPDPDKIGDDLSALVDSTPREYGDPVAAVQPENGAADSIVLAHGHVPQYMKHMFLAFKAIIDDALGLSRRQQEMIATLVSATNTCFY